MKRLAITLILLACLGMFITAFVIIYSPNHTKYETGIAIFLIIAALNICSLVLIWSEKTKTIYRAIWDGSIMELVNIDDDNDRLIAACDDFKHGECVKSDELVITRDTTIIEGLNVRLAYKKGVVVNFD